MELIVNEKPAWRNFKEDNPIDGCFYQHKSGNVFLADYNCMLLVVHSNDKTDIGKRYSSGGFSNCHNEFRRVEPVKFEFSVI